MKKNSTFHKRKVWTVFLLCAAMMLGLAGRLVYLMGFRSDYYYQKAQDLHERERSIKAARGKILDARGKVLASNKTVCTVSVIHSQIKEPEKIISLLSQKLELSEESIRKKVDVKIEKPWAPVAIPVDSVSVEISRGWHRAYIAIGSNMGDKKAYLDEAVEKLKNHPYCKVVKVSDYITTEPYGGVEQDVFLNGALEIKTLLYPEELLALLNRIEAEAGRERTIHWGPRTLDLDILFYDDCIIDSPALTVPHIDMQNRGFVLIPMAQIAPYHRHPVLGCTVGQLLSRLDGSLS